MDGNSNDKGFCMFYDWMEDFGYLDDKGFRQIINGIYNYHIVAGYDPRDDVDEKYRTAMSLIYHQLERQREQYERNVKRTEKMNSKSKSKGSAGTGDENDRDDDCEYDRLIA